MKPLLAFSAALFLPALLCSCLFAKDAGGPSRKLPSFDGNYVYSSKPAHGGSKASGKIIYVKVRSGAAEVTCTKTTVSSDITEVIDERMEKDGLFIDGARTYSGKAGYKDKVRRESGYIYCSGAKALGSVKRYKLEPGKPFAVDVSLLYLLLTFPFQEKNASWNIRMFDFAGHTITVSARSEGEERVTVPAGSYECYKMEVTVNIPILKPRINYWLTKSSPHFLVKHSGKLGLFSRQYVTVLEKRKEFN